MDGRPWQRHELIRVDPAAWPAVLAANGQDRPGRLLADWAARGLPVVVRRRMAGGIPEEPSSTGRRAGTAGGAGKLPRHFHRSAVNTGRDAGATVQQLHTLSGSTEPGFPYPDSPRTIPVGLALPPAEGGQRIALSLPAAVAIGRESPPPLAAARDAAPAAWSAAIAALLDLAEERGADLRTFGSLMWQHATGLPYLSPRSDLDLLWRVGSADRLMSLLAGIAGIERDGPMRIDGELLLADGSGVNWRELHQALGRPVPTEVLVKDMNGVRLADPRRLEGGSP